MYSQYEVADITIGINGDNSYLANRMSPFLSNDKKNSDLKVDFKIKESINVPDGELLMDDVVKWFRRPSSQGGFSGYRRSEIKGHIVSMFDTDEEWRNTSITYENDASYGFNNIIPGEYISFHILGVLFRNRILKHEGIVMHASSIDFEGKGIVFSAPSGTGKSTHVRLWETYMGDSVRVLNDDSPAIRLHDGRAFVYGTPWAGSTDKFINRRAPLTAIVVLEQAPDNSICRISDREAVYRLMARCFLPYFDNNMMNLAMDSFERIVAATPVYLLKCRPDRQAMELVYQCVK
ncbi:MAG: hypothetical protein N3I35_00775 [Clostridia bacterium]|nr:hypothetical protein [Clostridia bacterium]